MPYAHYVAPGLLAVSAMNGAVFDATFNVFFKIKYGKIYDAMLATPLRRRATSPSATSSGRSCAG